MGIFSDSGKNKTKSETNAEGDATILQHNHYDTGQKATNGTDHTEHSWTESHIANEPGGSGTVRHVEGNKGANAPRTRDAK